MSLEPLFTDAERMFIFSFSSEISNTESWRISTYLTEMCLES